MIRYHIENYKVSESGLRRAVLVTTKTWLGSRISKTKRAIYRMSWGRWKFRDTGTVVPIENVLIAHMECPDDPLST